MDRSRFETSVVALSRGVPSASSSAPGIPVLVIDEPDDAIAVGALAAHLATFRPDVIHNHMYRAELVGTRAAIALGEVGHAPAVRRLDGPLEPRPIRRGSRAAPPPDAATWTGSSRFRERSRRSSRTRVGPAWHPGRPDLQRRRPPALRPPGAVLHAARGVRDGARLADRGRRRPARAGEGPPDALRGVAGGAARRSRTRTCS